MTLFIVILILNQLISMPLTDNITQRILRYIGSSSDVLKASFSGKTKTTTSPWIRVTMRPILIKGIEMVQFSFYDQRKCIVKNYLGSEYSEALQELIKSNFKNIFIESLLGNLQIQVSKKGKTFINESKTQKTKTDVDLKHNRTKNYLLPEDVPSDFLEAVGIMSKEGKVKSEKQSKFRQLNGFLKIIDETFKTQKVIDPIKPELLAIDYGCGNAYLTFAVYNYFNFIIHRPMTLVGIDVNKELIESHRLEIEKLQWETLKFEATKISDYHPPANPDLVMALHACNTATDDALFKAIIWDAKMIFTSPCCHHHIQQQLSRQQKTLAAHAPLFRHGALSERFGDVLTDSFRALILRIMGYQTDVIEFVTSEHTNRNLIIRGVKGLTLGDKQFVEEYKVLKETWHVTPYLETLLGKSFSQYLI